MRTYSTVALLTALMLVLIVAEFTMHTGIPAVGAVLAAYSAIAAQRRYSSSLIGRPRNRSGPASHS